MPRSRFVSSERLLPLIVYVAVAFVALLVADWAVQALTPTRGARRLVVLGWFVLLPLGGWMVWRRQDSS